MALRNYQGTIEDKRDLYYCLKSLVSVGNHSGESHVKINGGIYSIDKMRFSGGKDLVGIAGPVFWDFPEKGISRGISFSISDSMKVTGRVPENIFNLLEKRTSVIGTRNKYT